MSTVSTVTAALPNSTSVSSYPRLAARTRNFTLGRPRDYTISPDGRRLLFVRSTGGTDPLQRLLMMTIGDGLERCLADPATIGAAADDELASEERLRRERAREQAGGIVAYATDHAVRRAVFTLGAQAWLTDIDTTSTRCLDLDIPVVDPRLDPQGNNVAWVHEGSLRVTSLGDATTHTLAGEDDDEVTWGLAEFIAGEEMGRTRGYWWSPDGQSLLVARVDTTAVQRWWISNPVDPSAAPQRIAYPCAGTANADVGLHLIGLDGARTEIVWDRAALPYLAAVHWEQDRPALVTVQSRDQRRLVHVAVEVPSGHTSVVAEYTAEPWIDLTPGAPRWSGERLVSVVEDRDADIRRIAVDGNAIGPADLHVREVLDVDASSAVVRGSRRDPTAIGVWRLRLDSGDVELLAGPEGVSTAAVRGGVTVVGQAAIDKPTITTVRSSGRSTVVKDVSTTSPVVPRIRRLELGPQRLQTALLRPDGVAADHPLPVLLDPYGGPHAQRVLQSQAMFRTSQWFADQGFAVLVIDGRGTPGRSLSFEHAVHRDLAMGVLDDQVTALHAAAEQTALDLDRVAIRGWSFGGYLAALAVLRRPDVFSAAIAGAPVTEWRLYDTHYTERYLGNPSEADDVYNANSLLPLAGLLERPLLLLHGLADDNVVAAHTLRLSQALLESGRAHQVLPLSGVTHMTPQDVVAENLLLLQAEFLLKALNVGR